MKRTLALLIAMIFVGAANAQSLTPADRAAVVAFVKAIEDDSIGTNFFSGVKSFAPLNAAERAFLGYSVLPPPQANEFDFVGLEQTMYGNLGGFLAYWDANGAAASIYDPSVVSFPSGIDSPRTTANFMVGALIFVEDTPEWKGFGPRHKTHFVGAPEIDSASAASGLTLLLGGLFVLRGRRPMKLGSAAA